MPSDEYLESRIAVMESKWFEHRNTSVRDLFNFMSELRYQHHHAYRYEMFGGVSEFKKTFERLSEKNGVHYLYIATHGGVNGLGGAMGANISTRIVANCISKADNSSGKLAGLYFGSCLFGNTSNLQNFIVKGSKLRWIAGYNVKIDFVKASIFDILFFNTLLEFRKGADMTEIQAIKETAKKLMSSVGGLISDLGFSLYLWERDQSIPLI